VVTAESPAGAAKPVHVEVTAAFLAECKAKQAAYAARRRRHTDGYREPAGDPARTWADVLGPVSLKPGAPAPMPAQRGHIHDRKQRTLALV
jgi:hypothetical protein